MRVLAALSLAASLMVHPAWSQAVQFKRCLNEQEIQVEQLVRHGVFLREAGRRCDEVSPGTNKMWEDFDRRWGAKLKVQTDKRAHLFNKTFKADALKVRTYFDGRLVTYHRNTPLTAAYCTNVRNLLTEITKRNWAGFANQAKVVQNEVLLDYKTCK